MKKGQWWLAFVLLALGVSGCSYMPSWLGGTPGEKKTGHLPGKRIEALANTSKLQPDAELAALPMDVPAAQANDAWAQHGGNAQADMENPVLPAKVSKQQSAEIGKGKEFKYKLAVSPVAAGGRVYAMDAYGYISAHDAKDVGRVKWVSKGVVSAEKEALLGGGLAVDKGRVYAVSGKGLVAAFDAASGAEVWRQSLNIPIRSAPRVDGGKLYVVTVDSQTYALDINTGTLLWTHRGINEGKGFLIEATPAVAEDTVIAPYASGEVHALHVDDGTDLWYDVVMGAQRESAISVFTGIGGDPVIKEGLLYVAGSADMFSSFQLENGRRLWDQPIASVNTPWVAGDYVFVLSTDSELIALNRMDGRVRWVRQLPQFANAEEKKDPYSWNGPVMAGGRLLVVGAHGEMAEIKPQDGTVLSMTEIPSGVHVPPVVEGGVLYLVSDDATLYALY